MNVLERLLLQKGLAKIGSCAGRLRADRDVTVAMGGKQRLALPACTTVCAGQCLSVLSTANRPDTCDYTREVATVNAFGTVPDESA